MLTEKARRQKRIIVFPEGAVPIIREAARSLAADAIVTPVLLGGSETEEWRAALLRNEGLSIEVITPSVSSNLASYTKRYSVEHAMPPAAGERIISQDLYYAAMMVHTGDAHGMVAGISYPTEQVLMAAELIIGLSENIGCISSFFLMDIPGFSGSEQGLLVFADPAVNPDPDSAQLADIAISTAESVQDLLGWTPRVAMLSFSTHGSAEHPRAAKVAEATALVRKKAPHILVDGEIQADAALIESVAKRKIQTENPVAGKANVLIFPDLDSANIGSKLVQRLGQAASYGPVLQGTRRPVSDLSRGATLDDIIGAAILVAARK